MYMYSEMLRGVLLKLRCSTLLDFKRTPRNISEYMYKEKTKIFIIGAGTVT